MWKMLPIPAPLIDSTSLASDSIRYRSKQRFILLLIYLGATASLCYLFLFAVLITNENSQPNTGEPVGLLQTPKSEKLHYQRNSRDLFLQVHKSNSTASRTSENNSRLQEQRRQLVLSSGTSTLSSSRTDPLLLSKARKTLFSLKKRRSKSHNGTSKSHSRRSHSSKIWSGHQDLDQLILKILPHRKHHHSSKPTASTEVYYYPWKKDEQCKNFSVHFAEKNTFKPRALVSFPGSGNSWLRYLIENASGYFTGSVYADKQLFNSGLLGELRPPNDGTTIVQKTHHEGYEQLSKRLFGYRGILIIRNPYEALVSFRNFMKSQSTDKHLGIADYTYFSGEEWEGFILQYIPTWSSIITTWIENSQDYLIVLYENIQKNPRRELVRILEYLDQPVDTARLDCLMKQENSEGPFHRARHPTKKPSTHIPLPLDSIPSTTSTTSQQDTKIPVERQAQKVESSSHHLDEQPLLLLDSKKSQQPQQHLQSESSSQTTTQRIESGKREEQKDDKFLSSPAPSFQTNSFVNSLQQQQNQYTSKMTSGSGTSSNTTTATITNFTSDNPNHDDNNNRLNKGSILRLDLIIQDNIDKINRFFQHKSIPVQLHYSLGPSTIPYFLPTTYINATTRSIPTTFVS